MIKPITSIILHLDAVLPTRAVFLSRSC